MSNNLSEWGAAKVPPGQINEIKGIARVKFLRGKVAEWTRLTGQAMEIVRTGE